MKYSLQDAFFQDIDELQNQGIGAADIQKLKVAGICTVRVRSVNLTRIQVTHISFTGNYHDTETCLVENQRHERGKS